MNIYSIFPSSPSSSPKISALLLEIRSLIFSKACNTPTQYSFDCVGLSRATRLGCHWPG